jgi:hypothetical protein
MIEVVDGIARYGYKAYHHQKAFHESTAKPRLLVGAAGPAGQSGKPHGRPAIASTETDLATLQRAGGWGIVQPNEAASAAAFDKAIADLSAEGLPESTQELDHQGSELCEPNQQAAELESLRQSNCPQTLCCPKTCRFDVSIINAFRLPKSMHLACPQ